MLNMVRSSWLPCLLMLNQTRAGGAECHAGVSPIHWAVLNPKSLVPLQARVKVLRSCESDPAGCVRHRLDDVADSLPSATDDDWNAGSEPAAPTSEAAPAKPVPSEDQAMAEEESYVLNQVSYCSNMHAGGS
jgi:hypothetical protein